MSDLINEKQKWTGLICPVCRFVTRIRFGQLGEAVVCPACDSIFNTSKNTVSDASDVIDPVDGEDDDDVLAAQSKGSGNAARRLRIFISKVAPVLGAIAFIALFAHMLTGRPGEGSEPETIGVVGNSTSEADAPLVSISASEAESAEPEMSEAERKVMNEKLTRFVSDFYAQTEVSAISSMVVHSDLTAPKMERYYQEHTWESVEIKSAEVIILGEDSDSDVIRARVDSGVLPKTLYLNLYFEKDTGQCQLHWESLVGWSEMTWAEYLEEKPREAQLMRLTCKEAYYYGGDYVDEEKWLCLKVEQGEEHATTYGYILRDLVTDSSVLADLRRRRSMQLTLRMQYPEESKLQNQLLIKELVRADWLDVAEP